MNKKEDSTPQIQEPSYPEIQKIIASERVDEVNGKFARILNELEKINKEKGGLGKSRDARKAMKAIEKVTDLLGELLSLKNDAMKAEAEVKAPQRKR